MHVRVCEYALYTSSTSFFYTLNIFLTTIIPAAAATTPPTLFTIK
jgi:hypothetical protein